MADDHQPVEADGNAAAVGQPHLQGGEKFFIESAQLLALQLPVLIFLIEPLALFMRIDELVIAVCQLDAGKIDLEALSDGNAVFLDDAGERCLRGKAGQNAQSAAA